MIGNATLPDNKNDKAVMNAVTPATHWHVSTPIVKELLRWIRWQGLDSQAFLATAGIHPDDLDNLAGQHDALRLEQAVCQALTAVDDPLIGLHLSPHLNMTALGIIGFLAQTCTTVGDLIQSLIRFGDLAGNVGVPALQHEPGRVLWTWDCHFSTELMSRHATECLLGCWAGLLRLRKQGSQPLLLAVHFRHALPAPGLAKEYQRFFGCPVHFNQSESALILPSRHLTDAMALADPNLHQMLALHADQQLQARRQQASLADKVRAQLRAVLAQGMTPVRDDIASMLGLSGRSLHRKLEEHGCNFRTLTDEVRLDIARNALADHTLTIAQLGSQLGFGDSQSFIRWFKKLEGVTPGDFRTRAPE